VKHSNGRPRFAAVIGHADEPGLLRSCIAHHLAIGVDHIFVSLNGEDAESAAVLREFAERPNVRAARPEAFADDPFQYFTAAKDVVVNWVDPDWLLFVDSDEFWLPAGEGIATTVGLDETDVFDVPRYNLTPVRERDGTVRAFELPDREHSLLVEGRRTIDPAYLERYPDTPIIMDEGASKVFVRPGLVAEVGRGAHRIVARAAEPRTARARDLLIAHAQYTTESRFRRKAVAIRARLAAYGDRFRPGEAWHWRRWLDLDDAGTLSEEFARQLFDADKIPALLSQRVLTIPARIFARERASCA
jgi:glycosyl transferase family 2